MDVGALRGSLAIPAQTPVIHAVDRAFARPERARIPELDGIRGLAILFVLVYHALHRLSPASGSERVIHQLASAGWMGVDLFFVLSGFLITGILLDAKGADGYFWRFYTRRALRILPLYFAFVILVLGVIPLTGLATAAETAQLQRAAPWYWAHSVNLLIAFFGWNAAVWNTGHLWSLAVEEQFYLLWPAVVFVLGTRALTRTLVGIIVGAALTRILMLVLNAPPMAVYVLLPTRMDALATGALLAVFARDPFAWRWVARWAAPAGLVMTGAILIVAYFEGSLRADSRVTEVFGYPAIAGLAAAVLISAVTAAPGSIRASVWNHSTLQVLGRYSYGLYVWHYPVVGLLHERLVPGIRMQLWGGSDLPLYAFLIASTVTASLLVAIVSWRLIEQPALRLKRFVPYR